MLNKFSKSIKSSLEKRSNIILFILVITLTFSLARNITRTNKANLKIEEAKLRVEKLRNENEELNKKLENVKEEFIEKQLRDKLGLAKEGEIIVVLPNEEILRKLAPNYTDEEETLPDPNWKKWMKLFL